MRYFKIALILFSFIIFIACDSTTKINVPASVAFYNVENLFDTIDAPGKIDEEFMPVEPKNWNTERYNKKIADLARVIKAIDSVNYPVLVGLAEVENETVLIDLIKSPALAPANYQIVWFDGPDKRGIDCALLVQSSVFKINKEQAIPVINETDPDFATRDILYVSGKMNGELFHVMVNHWPSRSGGEEASVPKRKLAAQVVRNKVDELFAQNSTANIIIMGDMNDEPGNESLKEVLKAKPNEGAVSDNDLVNLMYDEYNNNEGSYSYQGNWNMLDNIVVSGALINKTKGLKSALNNGFVFHQDFMEYTNNNGEISPNRTYGRSYFGGISDHFPVYMLLN